MLIPMPELEAIQASVSVYKSRRLKILKAIEATLSTIKKEAGYTNTVNTVTFDSKSWRDMAAPQTPAIFIIDDMVQINRFVGKTREYTWTVKLFGVVKEFTLEEFEEHIADIEECLEDNNHLAGMAAKVEVQQVITDNQMFENTNNRLYEIELKIEFIRSLNNPR
jgi:hypothetical protein